MNRAIHIAPLLPARPAIAVATLIVATFLAAGAGAQDYTHPRAMQLPATGFERPDPDALRLRLDNGLVAYVAEDHRAPLATLTAYLDVGAGHGKAGAAEALAAALRRGPASLAAGAFAARLRELNAEYRVTLEREHTAITLDVPVEEAWTAVDLLADTLAAPRFEAVGASVSSVPTATPAGAIDYSYSLDSAIEQFERRLFAGHPFAAEAAAGDVADARSLFEERVRAGAITVAFAGDFSPERARRELGEALADLPAGTASGAPQAFPALDAPGERELLLTQADRIQGWVVIGHELPVVPVEDEAALHVMDYILGAFHLDSRLLRESREKRGLTNDNSSFLEAGVRGPGAYSMRTYGRPEAVRLLIDITFRELARIRGTLATEDELFVAKGALVDGLWARRYATGLDAVQAYALEWLRYGSHERSTSYPARVAAVGLEDVQAAARKYLHPQRMIISVVGPLERIDAAEAIEDEPLLESWDGR